MKKVDVESEIAEIEENLGKGYGKKSDVGFDFNHGYGKQSDEIVTVYVIFPGIKKPVSFETALDYLKKKQNKFVQDSQYATFKPVAGICHAYIIGWSCGYETVFFKHIEDYNEYKDRYFASEPSGKYKQKRLKKVFKKGI